MEVWVTAACSKTRAALAGLEHAGRAYDRRSCIDMPPTPGELRDVLRRLDAQPWDVTRPVESREAGFADLPRDEDHHDQWVAQLCAHPRAIQRPIILLDDGSAVVCRDAATLDRVLGV